MLDQNYPTSYLKAVCPPSWTAGLHSLRSVAWRTFRCIVCQKDLYPDVQIVTGAYEASISSWRRRLAERVNMERFCVHLASVTQRRLPVACSRIAPSLIQLRHHPISRAPAHPGISYPRSLIIVHPSSAELNPCAHERCAAYVAFSNLSFPFPLLFVSTESKIVRTKSITSQVVRRGS